MSSEIALSVESLSKKYFVYQRPEDRLKQAVVPRLARLVGRSVQPFYREFDALKDVSFDIYRGETVGIIGRNGAGKSTLLQCICGTLTPTMGAVTYSGRLAALLELGAGFNPEFTGRENVILNASLLGLSDEEIEARFPFIVAFADIGHFIDEPVKTYSSGMFVRLAFGVIANVDADILIIDEALAVGDAYFVQKCMRFLREFKRKGTLLFVSHDSASIVALCDRALWLEGGVLRQDGSPRVVSDAYLADLYEQKQGGASPSKKEVAVFPEPTRTVPPKRSLDPRPAPQGALSAADIFQFEEDPVSFGLAGARVVDLWFEDEDGMKMQGVMGAEHVTVVIRVRADEPLSSPIVGFYLRDRLGQNLFGDNSYLTHRGSPVALKEGEMLECRFAFQMPILPLGDYSVCVAIADGTQDNHVQHQWIHDAMIIKSYSSSVSTGLIGIPMNLISMSRL